MSRPRIIITTLLIITAIPVITVMAAAAYFYAADRTNGVIESTGESREYLLYVPTSYDSAKPTPVVISMHALALWPAAQMEMSHWNELADRDGFIVVYPSGTGRLPKMWRMEPDADLMVNVTFISDLIDELAATYNIDQTRIYADGFSNGGGMSFVLSCTLSHRIAAVGAVAAAQVLPWNWCENSGAVPMIAFHGTSDRIVPYTGGPSAFFDIPFPSVEEWTARWGRRNGCEPNPIEALITEHVRRIEYTNCEDEAAVVLYAIQAGGHSWPGGKPMPEWMVGLTTREIDATAEMWAFFRQYQLRGQ